MMSDRNLTLMISKPSVFVVPLLGLACAAPSIADTQTRPSVNYLWYGQPAQSWESEALPIGNGRIGAMVFGGVENERLALNEISLWSGGENPGGGYGGGPEAGRDQFGAYQPFGDAVIRFTYPDGAGETSGYTRSLSLEDAVSTVSYQKGDVTYTREVYASYPDQVIVMTCSASKPGALSAAFSLKPAHTSDISISGNTIVMEGQLKNGEKFEARMTVIPKGGKTTAGKGGKVDVTYDGSRIMLDEAAIPALTVTGADSCTVIIAMATDYAMDAKKNWKGESPDKRNIAVLGKALKKPVEQIKKDHIANYKSLFDRCSVSFGKTDPAVAALPTDKRIEAYKSNPVDPELEETLFQFGRYAIISSSRPGSLPANLQGLWNDNVNPAWSSDYHSNINIQMNYWGVEPTNLSECHLPLISFFKAMEEPSQKATQSSLKSHSGGKTRGWTIRTSQNIYGGHGWEWNIPGAAWYAHHIWDHYAYTGDRDYLKNVAYPMMKEISMFWEDHLKELGEDGDGFFSAEDVDMDQLKGIKKGTLVAPNAWSPEHGPREDGVSHDQQLIWELFTNTIAAANTLGMDKKWAGELAKKRDLLAGPKIGPEGNLQEWMIDRIAKTQHRHTSHLYAVYPGFQISVEKTPELAEAAKKSLEWRGTTGDSRRSWTWPWRTGLWARFQDGDRAHDMVQGLIEHNLLPNMIATHPPLQFDGTFGITGGIAEMLLQSHTGEIVLLPAPAKAWPEGSVKGMKARGNVTVSFDWKDGKVTDYKLTGAARPVKVRVNGETKTVTPQPAR